MFNRNFKYTLNDVLAMDQYLMSMASYEVSKGLMVYPDNFDDFLDFQKKIKKQFVEFKKMIQNNECTIEELEQSVINLHGPIYNKYRNMSLNDSIEEYIKDYKDQEEMTDAGYLGYGEKLSNASDFFSILKDFLSEPYSSEKSEENEKQNNISIQKSNIEINDEEKQKRPQKRAKTTKKTSTSKKTNRESKTNSEKRKSTLKNKKDNIDEK